MAKMIPNLEEIRTKSPGEEQLFQKLKNDPTTSTWTVIHSLALPQHIKKKYGENDFIALIPYKGIVVLEVKASNTIERKDGVWFYSGKEGQDPFKSVIENLHTLKDYYLDEEFEDLHIWHCVVFTRCSLQNTEQEKPNWNDWELIDRKKLEEHILAEHLIEVLKNSLPRLSNKADVIKFVPKFDQKSVDRCAQLFMGNVFYGSPEEKRETHTKDLKDYTKEQIDLINFSATSNPRLYVDGGAGTGKTQCAIALAKNSQIERNKVLFLCFNRPVLVEVIKPQFNNYEKYPDINANTILSFLGNDILGHNMKKEFDIDRDYYNKLPDYVLDHLIKEDIEKYDELIIDESQDLMVSKYRDVFDLILQGGVKKGKIRFFGDSKDQSVRANVEKFEDVYDPNTFVALTLDHNVRNTQKLMEEIVNNFNFRPYSKYKRTGTIKPKWISYGKYEDVKNKLEDLKQELLNEGYEENEITVLTVNKIGKDYTDVVHRYLNEQIITKVRSRLNDPLNKKKREFFILNFETARRFKGCERRVIIIININENLSEQNLIYTAITRATERLYIIGDKQKIEDYYKNSIQSKKIFEDSMKD